MAGVIVLAQPAHGIIVAMRGARNGATPSRRRAGEIAGRGGGLLSKMSRSTASYRGISWARFAHLAARHGAEEIIGMTRRALDLSGAATA